MWQEKALLRWRDQFARPFHFHPQPVRTHVKTVRPCRRAVVQKNAREIVGVAKRFDHWAGLVDQRRAVMHAAGAVTETDLEAERPNCGNLDDLVHDPAIVLLWRRQ